MLSLHSTSVDQTRALGAKLSHCLRDGDLLLLNGELGSGKTAFVQGLARGLLIGDAVTSPTFTIMAHYEGRLPLHHVDAYRLSSPVEVFELALPETLDAGGVMVVEWGEIVANEIPRDRLELGISFGDGPDDRLFSLHPVGRSWLQRQPTLATSLDPWVAR